MKAFGSGESEPMGLILLLNPTDTLDTQICSSLRHENRDLKPVDGLLEAKHRLYQPTQFRKSTRSDLPVDNTRLVDVLLNSVGAKITLAL
ncbi:unnamed protein product [Protopolystoma xenopodis]|uniref:Uncharacterized protein n=1 Tax=Protopolystoma xenopodis TaxID=117903 RepID=A0A3S5FEZ3_9PLAT|nr:unnamed protein product [Protopolystoma xenopodis]